MKTQRNSSFELLRLVLMFMIVVHHCIVHGLGLAGITDSFAGRELILPDTQMPLAFGINALCICAVNCFVLISGYFGIRVTVRKFVNLLLTVFLYSLAFIVVPYMIKGNWNAALHQLMFLSHGPYWFVTDYLFLMVFAPVLNVGFDKLPQRDFRLVLAGLLVISCWFGFVWSHPSNQNGYTLLQFITMYCLGRELSRVKVKAPGAALVCVYAVCSLCVAAAGWALWLHGRGGMAWRTTYYNDPLVIVAAVALFLLFARFPFRSELINRLARSSFAIYLFQSSISVEYVMYNAINQAYAKSGG